MWSSAHGEMSHLNSKASWSLSVWLLGWPLLYSTHFFKWMFFHSLYYLFLWLCWVFVAVWRLASRGYSLVTTPGFLLTVASLVGHRPCSLSSAAVAHSLRCPAADVIFQTRGQTQVPCIGRQVLYHWTTREIQHSLFKDLQARCCFDVRKTHTQIGSSFFSLTGPWLGEEVDY